MLVSKQLEHNKGDLVAFKLVNGDEIIAEIMETTMMGWILKKPCTVLPSPQGIGLMQYLFVGDVGALVELQRQHVMVHAAAVPEIQAHYFKTTTGIDTPPKQGIIV